MKALPLMLLIGLVGCGPIVQVGGNAPAPTTLLTLSTTAQPRPYSGPATGTLGIAVPAVPAALQTLRLPVVTGATALSYLEGATWAEQPNRQFQRLLSDTVAADGQAVIDMRTGNLAPARTLTGTLREFGLDVSGSPVVRVRYDAQLAGPRGSGAVAMKRFEASEPVVSQQPLAVAAALNRAANRVAGDVSAWVRS